MELNVSNEIIIARPRNIVASFAAEPENAPKWYKNIRSVEPKTSGALQVGSRFAFVAQFLGRRLSYTYEIVEFVRGEKLTMRTHEGPFPMETTYSWRSVENNSTAMSLRNRGTPRGFSSLVLPFMAWAVRRANRKDLLRLKSVLEGRPAAD